MSQNTQQYPRVGTDLQALPDASHGDLPGQVDTLKIVACPICQATYVPADEQPAPGTSLLETAFLGVCRFCFRCQRPACPQCWNPIHHTCASCSEEARLPFRKPVPSLEGLVFLPSTSTHVRPENAISFTCRRNGRFYMPEEVPTRPDPREAGIPAPTASMPVDPSARLTLQAHPDPQEFHIIQPAHTANIPAASGTFSAFQTNYAVPAPAQAPREIDHYPTWLQEILGQKVDEPFTPPVHGGEQPDFLTGIHAQAAPTSSLARANEHTWPQMAPTAQQQTAPAEAFAPPAFTGQLLPITLPAPEAKHQNETIPEEDTGDDTSLFERVENVLIVITSILLLAVVLMIVLSIISAQVNTFFLHLLHIDIRTEIAYLLQLR